MEFIYIHIYIYIYIYIELKRTHRFSVTLSFASKRSSDRTFCLTKALALNSESHRIDASSLIHLLMYVYIYIYIYIYVCTFTIQFHVFRLLKV